MGWHKGAGGGGGGAAAGGAAAPLWGVYQLGFKALYMMGDDGVVIGHGDGWCCG